jgi:hypothetical protein
MSSHEEKIHLKYLERREALRKNDCDIVRKLDLIIDDLEQLFLAFPDGPTKHREAHEAWIQAKEAEKHFYDSLKEEVLKKGVAGVFAILVIILGLALSGLATELVDHGILRR